MPLRRERIHSVQNRSDSSRAFAPTRSLPTRQLEQQADHFAASLGPQQTLFARSLRDGDAIPEHIRATIEPQLGWSFARVRLFAGSERAGRGPAASTCGRDVRLGAGRFSLDRVEQVRLLAHELVHVVQQGAAEPLGSPFAPVVAPVAGAPTVQHQERGSSAPVDEAAIQKRARADARHGDDLGMLRTRVLHEHFASDAERRLYTRYFLNERVRFWTGADLDPDSLAVQAQSYEDLYQQNEARLRIEARAAAARREEEAMEQEVARLETEERMSRMAVDVRGYPVLAFHAAVGQVFAPFVEFVETAIKFVPVAGEVVMGLEAVLGQELLTGRQLSRLERGLDLVFALLPFAGPIMRAGSKGAGAIYNIVKQTGRSAKSIIRMLRGLEELSPAAVKTLEEGLRAGKLGERELLAAEDTARALGSEVKASRLTGARELPVGDYEGAEKAYDEIRAASDDVDAISKNTGLAKGRIQRIKDHIFYRTHALDEGQRLFDADPQIANAWRRLVSGTHRPEDLQLLEHEIFEAKFEGIFKTDYRTAHQAANRSGRLSGLE